MYKLICLFTTLLMLSSSPLVAQDYILYTSAPATATLGEAFDQSTMLDTSVDGVQGYSFGACHDSTLMTLDAVVDGATTLVIKNGGPPDFNQVNVLTDGFTVGVVICFTGCATLASGTGYELNVATYTADVEGVSTTSFCDTLGAPAVDTVIVVNGASVAPEQLSVSVEILGVPPIPDPEFIFSGPTESINYDGNSGLANFSVAVQISETDHSASGADFPHETQGFSMGMANDSAVMECTGISVTLPFDADFAEGGIFSDGWTVGVVFSFTGGSTLGFTEPLDVVVAEYSTVAGALSGTGSTETALTWSDLLGSPPVANIVVVDGASLNPELVDGSITLQPVFDQPFLRGNCNGNSGVNIADGIWMLQELHLGGASGTCAEACDANGDGGYDTADAIYVIYYRLLDGPAPTAPFPDCGAVAGVDCDATNYCP
ncbi:MAG: hypothetical protein OSB09_06450 [Planctomycetota bacterium]|nr:hypothetical protein [Planctomycetota bacterium]